MLVWYVIQVINGREDVMRERIERVVPAGAMQELFYPQFQTEIKVHGEWVYTTKPLFPGYLICAIGCSLTSRAQVFYGCRQ